MANKLAIKHKNSLALNENKISRESEGGSKKIVRSCLRPFGISSFLIIMCCIFIGFWFIMCPLIWTLCYSSYILYDWPKYWPILFWIVALIIWILIVTLLVYIWKCMKKNVKHNANVKRRSYGSDDTNNHTYLMSENVQSTTDNVNKKNDKTDIDIESSLLDNKDRDEKNVNDSNVDTGVIRKNSKRKNDLPPLVIHRESRNNIDNINSNNMKTNNDKELKMNDDIRDTTNDVDKNSMKDYLTLVTVTPFEEDTNTNILSSPKTPMSPRDLFFIDLIRQAEQAEKNKDNNNKDDLNKRHSRFFPENSSIPSSTIDSVDNKSNNNSNDNKKDDKENDENKAQRKSEYFIAEVESPKHEITEVFIEVDDKTIKSDNKKDSLDLCTVKMNDSNSELPVLEIKTIEKDDANKN